MKNFYMLAVILDGVLSAMDIGFYSVTGETSLLVWGLGLGALAWINYKLWQVCE